MEVAFPGRQSEIDRPDIVFLKDRHRLLEGRDRTSHVFRADHRSAIGKQSLDEFFENGSARIAMEADHVAVFQSKSHLRKARSRNANLTPQRSRQRLGGVAGARPLEGSLHQRHGIGHTPAMVFGLIVQTPQEDSLIVGIAADQILDHGFEFSPTGRIIHIVGAGGHHPLRVVVPAYGIGLFAQMRIDTFSPVRPEGRQRPDLVLVAQLQELRETLLESRRIRRVDEIGEEDPHRIESQPLRKPQFTVDRLGIKGLGLPHFDLVDGRRGHIITPHDPALVRHPLIGPFGRPAFGHYRGFAARSRQKKNRSR